MAIKHDILMNQQKLLKIIEYYGRLTNIAKLHECMSAQKNRKMFSWQMVLFTYAEFIKCQFMNSA